MVFGGIVAGAIGFAIATFVMPGGSGESAEEVAALKASIDKQSGQIDSLLSELDTLKTGSGSDDQIAAIDARVTETLGSLDTWLNDLGSQLDEFDARIAEVETRPALPAGADGSAAMEAQLQAFRQQLECAACVPSRQVSSRRADVLLEPASGLEPLTC